MVPSVGPRVHKPRYHHPQAEEVQQCGARGKKPERIPAGPATSMGGSSRRSGPGKFSKLRREGDGMRDVGGAAIASNVIGDEEDELHVAAAHAVNSARRSDGCDDDDDDYTPPCPTWCFPWCPEGCEVCDACQSAPELDGVGGGCSRAE